MKRGIVLFVLLLAACGPKYDYPDGFKNSFTSSCLQTSGGESGYCDCALGWLQDNIPYADAAQGEGISDAVSACAGEIP